MVASIGKLRHLDWRALVLIACWTAALAYAPSLARADQGAPLTQLSFDPFTNPDSQHRTQVEPGSFSNGHQIVSAFQSGRFFGGGASDIGWATSNPGGRGWRFGFLPGTTSFVGGPYASVTDPSVAYDARHRVWLIASVPIDSQAISPTVLVSRSRDALHWSDPVSIPAFRTGRNFDKTWIACDNTPTSPFFGHCYTEFDDNARADVLEMSTSTDGGVTWTAAQDAALGSLGYGGQPVVQPDGTVIVPFLDFINRSILVFRSTDGGASWSAATTVSPLSLRPAAGALRDLPLPSAAIDARGRVYVVWQDCRFRAGCGSNDLVLSTSDDGVNWSAVSRVPIDPLDSGADHFIPGLAVDQVTSGNHARLALAYYYYPSASCTAATCQLDVGLIRSADGGANWGHAHQLAGPMSLSWLPSTSQGVMVGDYIATSFLDGHPNPFFALARPPRNGLFHQAIFTTAAGFDQPEPDGHPGQPFSGSPDAATGSAAGANAATGSTTLSPRQAK